MGRIGDGERAYAISIMEEPTRRGHAKPPSFGIVYCIDAVGLLEAKNEIPEDGYGEL